MDNVLEGLQKQIKRCIELKTIYDEIPSGKFASLFIQKSITEGEKALVSGDVIEQIRCYKELEDCQ